MKDAELKIVEKPEPPSYEEFFAWRFLVEYHIEKHPPYHPSQSQIKNWEFGWFEDDFPEPYGLLLGEKGRESRERLYNFYHCNLFYWNGHPKHHRGWYLTNKDSVIDKIRFLEKVILFGENPQLLRKPWLEEQLYLLEGLRPPLSEENAFKLQQVKLWLLPHRLDAAVLGGKGRQPRPYDAVLGTPHRK